MSYQFQVQVLYNDIHVPVASDGYVGNFGPGVATLSVQILEQEKDRFHGITVDSKKNVVLKKDLAPVQGKEGKLYSAKCQIKLSMQGIPSTEYPENNLRLIELKGGGKFSIWEIALISQGGKFFLTVQETYRAECFLDEEGKIVCPHLDRWPQLLGVLEGLINREKLKPVSCYQPPPELDATNLGPNEGRVLWWNDAQGLGAIITPQGSARVHWSSISPRPRRSFLIPGETITFFGLYAPRETKGRPTSFRWEARGIRTS